MLEESNSQRIQIGRTVVGDLDLLVFRRMAPPLKPGASGSADESVADDTSRSVVERLRKADRARRLAHHE